MANFHSEIKERSGLVLGGLGTGSVELFPDGELHEWQIYNTARLTSCCREEKVDDGEAFRGALSFYLRCDDGERVVLRKLAQSAESEEFTYRMFPFVKPIAAIDADLRFPEGTLVYLDPALPITASGSFVSSFVPHDSALSALPCFSVSFSIENPTDREITVSLLAKFKSEFANLSGERYTVSATGGDALLSITPKSAEGAADGSLCLSLSGKGEASYLGGDYTLYLDEYVSHSRHGITQESFLFDFYKDGVLPNTVGGEALSDDFFDEGDLDEKIAILKNYAFAESLLSRLLAVYPDYLATDEGKRDFLSVCQRQLRDFSRRKKAFGGSALCETLTLMPHEATEVEFVFSWYFPCHYGENGKYLGHFYENLATDATNVIEIANNREVFRKARSFSAFLYETTVAPSFSDAWSLHLSTLVKDSWYLKNGDFGLWEGLGFCGFNTTDILYHASHGLAVLFPDLESRILQKTASFQREDGRIPHFFTPDLDSVDDGFHRVDMNLQFVLLVGRDYLVTGDKEALASLWQSVKDAIAAIDALDTDGDCLPDHGTAYNTYDAWHFEGIPSYIAILWLSALKMAAYLAKVLDDEIGLAYDTVLAIGLRVLEEKLYNGKCYDLWVTEDGRRDHAVMSDQLDGEIFLRLTLGEGNLSDEQFRSVLHYLVKTNYKKGEGLVNATFPKEYPPTVYTYQNCQARAQWTGIGYLVAAALLSVGELTTAQEMIETIHQNQRDLGLFFNHWECGFRYTRPLSSFLTLTAFVRFDPIKRQILLCRHQLGRFPLITATATATVTVDVQNGEIVATVEVVSGELTVEGFVTMAGRDDLVFPVTLCEGETKPFHFE